MWNLNCNVPKFFQKYQEHSFTKVSIQWRVQPKKLSFQIQFKNQRKLMNNSTNSGNSSLSGYSELTLLINRQFSTDTFWDFSFHSFIITFKLKSI